MAIDPKKTLVIYNSNSTLYAASLPNAEFYATARGLRTGDPTTGSYNRMGFDFGSTVNTPLYPAGVPAVGLPISALTPTGVTTSTGATSAYDGLPLLKAIAQFVADNNIDGLLVECNVPPYLYVGYDPSFGSDYCPIEVFLAFAPLYPNGVPAVPPPSGPNGNWINPSLYRGVIPGATAKPVGSAFVDGNLLTGVFPKSPTLCRFKAAQRLSYLANGRIGYPGASSSDVQRIVNDAIWAETQDNRYKLHVIGGSPYTASNVPYDNVSSHVLFVGRGFSNMAHFDADSAFSEYTGSTISASSWSGAGYAMSFFGLLYGNGSQTLSDYRAAGSLPDYLGGSDTFSSNGHIYDNCQPLRGGWAFAWQSSAWMLGTCNLLKGGVAGVVNARAEPYVQGLPGQLEFAASLVEGLSMMESVHLSAEMTAPKTTVYGDPMYRPYKATSFPPNELSQG